MPQSKIGYIDGEGISKVGYITPCLNLDDVGGGDDLDLVNGAFIVYNNGLTSSTNLTEKGNVLNVGSSSTSTVNLCNLSITNDLVTGSFTTTQLLNAVTGDDNTTTYYASATVSSSAVSGTPIVVATTYGGYYKVRSLNGILLFPSFRSFPPNFAASAYYQYDLYVSYSGGIIYVNVGSQWNPGGSGNGTIYVTWTETNSSSEIDRGISENKYTRIENSNNLEKRIQELEERLERYEALFKTADEYEKLSLASDEDYESTIKL